MIQNIFLSCPKHFDYRFILVIIFYFQILKREHINLSSHMSPLYIKTAYNNGLHLFWFSWEWFCLQISSDRKYFPLLSKALWSRINTIFKPETNKEHIIDRRVISRHMGPIYIETSWTLNYVFTAASHQTGLDTRSMTREPIIVGILERGRLGTSQGSYHAGLCYSLTH